MASTGATPTKAGGKAAVKVPAAIAKLSLEDLQNMCVDTLKKLRARDKRIEVSRRPHISCSSRIVHYGL